MMPLRRSTIVLSSRAVEVQAVRASQHRNVLDPIVMAVVARRAPCPARWRRNRERDSDHERVDARQPQQRLVRALENLAADAIPDNGNEVSAVDDQGLRHDAFPAGTNTIPPNGASLMACRNADVSSLVPSHLAP